MRPIISARHGLLLAILLVLPAVVWAQTSEGPASELEILWEFDTGG